MIFPNKSIFGGGEGEANEPCSQCHVPSGKPHVGSFRLIAYKIFELRISRFKFIWNAIAEMDERCFQRTPKTAFSPVYTCCQLLKPRCLGSTQLLTVLNVSESPYNKGCIFQFCVLRCIGNIF